MHLFRYRYPFSKLIHPAFSCHLLGRLIVRYFIPPRSSCPPHHWWATLFDRLHHFPPTDHLSYICQICHGDLIEKRLRHRSSDGSERNVTMLVSLFSSPRCFSSYWLTSNAMVSLCEIRVMPVLLLLSCLSERNEKRKREKEPKKKRSKTTKQKEGEEEEVDDDGDNNNNEQKYDREEW